MNVKRATSAWIPALAYMAVIFVVSGDPQPPVPPGFAAHDKAAHFAAYFGLALLVFRAVVMVPLVGRIKPYWQTFILSVFHGASDEFHQRFVPGRTMSGLDWIADIIGVAAALAVIHTIRTYRKNGGM